MTEVEMIDEFMDTEPLVPTVRKTGLVADHVRHEASRRMQVLVGARDAHHLDIIIANATREAIRLLRKGTENWSDAERVRAGELEAIDDAIEAIRAASNLLESTSPIPADYRDDYWWPVKPQ